MLNHHHSKDMDLSPTTKQKKTGKVKIFEEMIETFLHFTSSQHLYKAYFREINIKTLVHKVYFLKVYSIMGGGHWTQKFPWDFTSKMETWFRNNQN